MAEQKLSYKQVAEPDLLEPLKKEILDVDKLLSQVEGSLKTVIGEAAKLGKLTPLDSFANLEKREQGIKDTAEALKGLDKVEKDRAKLQERLASLEDVRIKKNFDLKEEIRLQTKELRDNAKAANANAYEKLTKQVNEAQKEFKRLNAELQETEEEFGASSDQALQFGNQVAEAEKNFLELDARLRSINEAAKDGRRDVGRYEKGFKEIKSEVKVAEKEFKKLSEEFGENSVQARRAEKRLVELNESLDEIKKNSEEANKRVSGLTKAFKAFATATIVIKVLELLNNAVSSNSDGAADLQKIWVRVTGTFQVVAERLSIVFPVIQARFEKFVVSIKLNFAQLKNTLSDNQEDVDRLEKEYEDLAKVADTDISNAFKGLGAEIDRVISRQIELIDKTLEYRRAIVENDKAVTSAIETQQQFRDSFEDDSRALNELIENGVAYRDSLLKTQKLEEDSASKRVELARINADASRGSIDAQEQLAQAEREYVQLVADNASELTATQREIQKFRDDVTQQNLDFYIDDFDNRKTVNERIIADETQTFDRRKELLAQNLQLSEDSFTAQAEALNKSLTERGKAELDFDTLRKETSSDEIARIVQEAGLSEQLNVRVLEILRERRTVLQDNTEAQRDLNLSEQESAALLDDIALQQKALNKVQEEGVDLERVLQTLAEERLQSDIVNLRERIAVAEDGSASFIALNQELNDKLLEQTEGRIAKEKTASEKALADLQQTSEVAFDLLGDAAKKRSERRIEAIDEELAAEQVRLQGLQALAAEGNEDAKNNLALNEQRQKQLELEREQQIKRQQRAELALTAVQTYAAKTTAGDPNPLASTIADIEVLRAFIGSLPTFYGGSERVGDDLNPALSGRDGHIIRVDGDERILKPSHANMIPKSMSNLELAMLAQNASATRDSLGGSRSTPDLVVRELVNLQNITKNSPTYLGADYDEMTNMVTKQVQKGRKLERVHRKKGGIWG